jgi:hypothetical protein
LPRTTESDNAGTNYVNTFSVHAFAAAVPAADASRRATTVRILDE